MILVCDILTNCPVDFEHFLDTFGSIVIVLLL